MRDAKEESTNQLLVEDAVSPPFLSNLKLTKSLLEVLTCLWMTNCAIFYLGRVFVYI